MQMLPPMHISNFISSLTSASALMLALWLYAPTPAHSRSPCTNATTVNTSIGRVKGEYVADGDYVAFRGMPYAQPPEGNLRFEAPRPYQRPTSPTVRDATAFGPQCIQLQFGSLWAQPVPESEQSEDCLTLNVFAPQPCRLAPPPTPDRKALRPMLVWMHGGGLAYGSASGFEPKSFLQNNPDIVVASFNYRLNVFGFPDAPALNSRPDAAQSSNPGLRDQRLAIRWLHTNARAFGVDPDRIVLLGFSAGSQTADQYLFAYPDSAPNASKSLASAAASSTPYARNSSRINDEDDNNGNGNGDSNSNGQRSITDIDAGAAPQYSHVAGAWLMSNVASVDDGDAAFYDPREWARVAANAGCARNDTATAAADAAELACMRRVDARALSRAISTPGDSRVIVGAGTPRGGQPRPDNITFFAPAALRQRVADGKYARVPIVVGTLEAEGDNLMAFSPRGNNHTASDILTQFIFQCPAARRASLHASLGLPVWRYLFRGIFPSYQKYAWVRPYHELDVFLTWGIVPGGGANNTSGTGNGYYSGNDVGRRPPLPAERAAIAYMQAAVAAFVRDPRRGLTQFGWPEYKPDTPSLVELFGPKNATGAAFSDARTYDEPTCSRPLLFDFIALDLNSTTTSACDPCIDP